MVSNHADAAAYEYLLEAFLKAVLRLARQVVNGTVIMEVEGVSQSEVLGACAAVMEDGLFPAFMMIDGDDAERKAIETVFPDTAIRMCQFHLMQACRSKIKRVMGRRPNVDV